MEKINIAKILKDCPSGMELDCTMYENVYFDKIYDEDCLYQIGCYTINDGVRNSINFTKYGKFNTTRIAKCAIFPKGKTTWDGFQRPFVDGDVVVAEDTESFQLFLLKHLTHSEDDIYDGYCYFGWNFQSNELFPKGNWVFNRHATEEEKEKLFDAIKSNGYKWNPETKTLEKLPKFKVGDVIQDIDTYKVKITEVNIEDGCYEYESIIAKGIGSIAFNEQDDYELVPNKFDITTLKPYDKVLYRMHDKDTWCNGFYSFYKSNHHFVNSLTIVKQCIPYEENKYLLGTTNDCEEFYKTWE